MYAAPFLMAVALAIGNASVWPATADLKSAAWEAVKARRSGKGPALLVVRPSPQTTWYGRIPIGGVTDSGAEVRISGSAIHVFPNGAFAGIVSLKYGANALQFEARNAKGVTRRTIEVTRLGVEPAASAPASVPFIDASRAIEPAAHEDLAPGDLAQVSFYGTAGQAAAFQIGGQERWFAMRERAPGKGDSSLAIYEGSCRLQSQWMLKRAPVHLRLARPDSSGTTATATAPGALTLIDLAHPRVVESLNPHTPVYTSHTGRSSHGTVLEGARFAVIGRQGKRWRVSLGATLDGWIDADECRELAQGEPEPRGFVERIDSAAGDRGTTISLALTSPLPAIVREELSPAAAVLRIYGLEARLWWVETPHPAAAIAGIQWEQTETGVVELRAPLNPPHAWGWDLVRNKEGLHWSILAPPALKGTGSRPLEGLRIVVDAGHGGIDAGASGSTGLKESVVNLAEARLLKDRLESGGARVFMTRSSDVFVPLDERIRFANEKRGDLFISLHNNSNGDDEDPLEKRGTLAIFYHPHSRRLAESLYARLSPLATQEEKNGVVEEDVRVVRALTRMPAVLIEGAFITHPEDEARLMTGKFLDSLNNAIYKGILDFLDPLRDTAGAIQNSPATRPGGAATQPTVR